MAAPIRSLDRADATCWRCGAPGDAGCVYSLLLVADSRHGLDAFGHPVTRGKWQDKLRVRVPCCADCRFRLRLSPVIVFGSAGASAIAATILQPRLWPQLETPSSLHMSHEGIGNTATGIGIVLGFVAAMLGIALHRRLSGIRSLSTYPPLIPLRQAGWHYPSAG